MDKNWVITLCRFATTSHIFHIRLTCCFHNLLIRAALKLHYMIFLVQVDLVTSFRQNRRHVYTQKWSSSNSGTVLLPVSQREKHNSSPCHCFFSLLCADSSTSLWCHYLFLFICFSAFFLLPRPKWLLHKNQTETRCSQAERAEEK